MSKHQTADIRNIALAGHRASGKTSLADALLFKAKAVERRGSVDDGTSVSDYDDEEHEHHFSIDASVLHLDHQGKHVNLLDTPGYPDFIGAALGVAGRRRERGRRGLGRQRRRGQHAAHVRRGRPARPGPLPRHQQARRRQHQLRSTCSRRCSDTFGKGCVLFNAPDQPRPQVQRRRQRARIRRTTPAGCPVDLAAARSQLVDAIVEVRRGPDGKVPDRRDHRRCRSWPPPCPKALAAGTVVPIFCTSARRKGHRRAGAARRPGRPTPCRRCRASSRTWRSRTGRRGDDGS